MKKNHENKVIRAKKAATKTFITGLVGVLVLVSMINLKSCCYNKGKDLDNSTEIENQDDNYIVMDGEHTHHLDHDCVEHIHNYNHIHTDE